VVACQIVYSRVMRRASGGRARRDNVYDPFAFAAGYSDTDT
jgi:hypothetical protein